MATNNGVRAKFSRKKHGHRPCSICRHPDRPRIEALRLAGATLGDIAASFPTISAKAVWRHMRNHVTEAEKAEYLADVPLKEVAKRAAEEGDSLLDYFNLVRSVVLRQMLLAASVNDGHRVASLATRATEVLREIGRLTGELLRLAPITNVSNTAIFINSPIFAELQSMLVEKLAPHPQALAAVVEGLRELEGRSAPEGLATRRSGPYAAIEHAARQCTAMMGARWFWSGRVCSRLRLSIWLRRMGFIRAPWRVWKSC
jgi:hypothetical protein